MSERNTNREAAESIGAIGSIVAGLVSWEFTHNIWWTIWHILGGWVYVIYRAFVGLPQ